jgi:tetratricopeptide (TPR) repeat protein
LLENLELSFQLGSKRQTAFCYLDLGQVALATGRTELAEMNFQECINLLDRFGESHDLALGLIYLGKCLTARREFQAARKNFHKVVQIGKSLSIDYLVYWGLVNLARINDLEGQTEQALEQALILQESSCKVIAAQNDSVRLVANLQARLSPGQVEAAKERIKGMTIDSLLDQSPS